MCYLNSLWDTHMHGLTGSEAEGRLVGGLRKTGKRLEVGWRKA